MSIDKIEVAKEKFGKLIEEQLARVERMKADKDFIDYASLPVIKIGICGGDGIGHGITTRNRQRSYGSTGASIQSLPVRLRSFRMIWRLHKRTRNKRV